MILLKLRNAWANLVVLVLMGAFMAMQRFHDWRH